IAKAVETKERKTLDLARLTLKEGEAYHDKGPGIAEQSLNDRFAQADETISKFETRRHVLAAITQLLVPKPSAETVKSARDIARRARLDQDPEVLALIGELYQAMRRSIRYVTNPTPLGVGTPEPPEPSLLVVPSLAKPPDGKAGAPAIRQREVRQDV